MRIFPLGRVAARHSRERSLSAQRAAQPWRIVLTSVLVLSCVEGATAPARDFRLEDTLSLADSALAGPPGGALLPTIRLRAIDVGGMPVSGARVVWSTSNSGAAVDAGTALTGDDGVITGTWVLGMRALERQRLVITVTNRGGLARTFSLEATARPVTVASYTIDSVATKLGTPVTARVTASDPYGNRFSPDRVSYESGDTTLFAVDSLGVIQPRRRGEGAMFVAIGAMRDTVSVRVFQVVSAIVVEADTARFTALGARRPFAVRLVDDLGLTVADSVPAFTVADTSVGDVVAGEVLTFLSRANGATRVVFTAGEVVREVWIVVAQEVARIVLARNDSMPIVNVAVGERLPVTCRAYDRNDVVVPLARLTMSSRAGVVSGDTCDALVVVRSGRDTVRAEAAGVLAELAIVVAARMTVISPIGENLRVDSLPANTSPWAPSARVNSRGQVEVYFAAYQFDSLASENRGDLHRLVSDDGQVYRYDGVALRRDDDPCAPHGSGIENVTIVPRTDGSGWRMFFAAGSFPCYGWQVFSAVSQDERSWEKEPGVRLSNGGSLPPDDPVTPPWPVGEGMEMDRLASGEWRMIASTYEHVLPRVDKWQIAEWRSSDQLSWRYVSTVLTTREMPSEGSGSIYSPVIREVAPGVFRMIFCGDDRGSTGARSRLWSAVSTDKTSWQLEGEVLGEEGRDVYYATLARDRLIYIRLGADATYSLASVSVQMQ